MEFVTHNDLLTVKIGNIAIKNIKNPDPYIYLYQTFYEIKLFDIKRK